MTTTFDAFTPPPGIPEPAPTAAPEPLADFPVSVPVDAHVMPSGAWVQIEDARTLTRGDKKQILRGGMVEGDDIDRGYGLFDALLARLVTAWSYPHPIPSVDLSVMDLLPAEDDDALTELAKDAERLLFPKAPSPDDHDNPASPTAPSSE